MTIDETFDRLRKLQDILAEKIELEKKLQDIPKALEDREALLVSLKKRYIEQDQEYEELRSQQADCRNQLLEAESRREKAEKNMEATVTQREVDIITKEIEDATSKENQCRDELLHVERRLTDLDNKMKANKAMIDNQENELVENKKLIEQECILQKQKIVTLASEDKALSAGLDSELLFKFERIIRKKGDCGIVAVKAGVCESCHMILPVQFANTVRQKKEIVSCPYCSSFLYYEESSDGEESFLIEDVGSLADLEDDEDELDEEDDDDEEDPTAVDFDE